MLEAGAFLYTGPDPIQTHPEGQSIVIEPQRAAVVRGHVRDRGGNPIEGVDISILGHAEFGTTTTREDGMLDMAVNGGGLLTVDTPRRATCRCSGRSEVPWQDYAWLPDVVMIAQDPTVTAIDLTADTPIQVARGSVVTDC